MLFPEEFLPREDKRVFLSVAIFLFSALLVAELWVYGFEDVPPDLYPVLYWAIGITSATVALYSYLFWSNRPVCRR